ncbi:PDGLE domain-containing protein [Actinomadura darangshiensis]|uniref:PDGLE domain-containing protein n=1 Tax=Actinomadura darangshiensis TaxID=705336 RepID=UPI001A9EC81A|nr:PDGLE domain-containing protein [Actinomadura darangshiensis]
MTSKRFFAGFLLVSLILAGVVSYYASSNPDGLEKVASDKGISAKEKNHSLKDSPFGDYGVKGIDNARLSGGLSGLIGVGVVLLVGGGLFWGVRRRGSAGADPAAEQDEKVPSETSRKA